VQLPARLAIAAVGVALGLGRNVVCAQVVAVVSSTSPITTLTRSQVTDIFLGKRARFPDGSLAVPIDLTEGTAAHDEFYSRIADMSPAQVKAFWSKLIFTGRGQPPISATTSVEAKKMLLANPNAISYMDEKLVDSRLRVVFVP
jgi:hypothetical protein